MEIDPDFKHHLKRDFIATAQRATQKSMRPWRALLPVAGVLALFLVVTVPLLNKPASQSNDEFSQLESTLVRLENALRADVAQAQEADEEQLTAYVNQLSHIVLLLERLIERLELAGKDANVAKAQLAEAKSKLTEAEAKAKHPETPVSETKENLGDVAGILRTSVTSAKQAL